MVNQDAIIIAPLQTLLSESPYPGLRPFQHNEAGIFFGREEQTDQLLEKLQRFRFIAVVGQSGCGKSSLVRAGLIAALEAGFLAEAGARWRIADMRPGGEPYARLARALLSPTALGKDHEIEPDDFAFVMAALRRGPQGLVEVLRERPLPDGGNLLLLVDQFEEIFRFRREGDPDEADALVALLLATAAQREVPVYVIITMRSDFIGHCAVFSGLPEAINDSQFLTPRLTREQSEAAITKPARVFSGKIDPLLVNRLLNDLGPDPARLPVLQHALMRMWTRADGGREAAEANGTRPITISVEDYDAVGTLANALSRHADEVYESLNDRQKQIAEVMFRRLTERGVGQPDTRRPAKLGDVADVAGATTEDVIAVVEEFRKPDRSFVTPPVGVPLNRETILDIGHESLIRQWTRLNEWANSEAISAAMYKRLKQTAILWKAKDADPLEGISLERAREWKERQNPTVEWASRYGSAEEFALATEFLETSEQKWDEKQKREKEEEERRQKGELERVRLQEKAKEGRRFKHLSIALGFVVILLLGAVAWAVNLANDSSRKSKEILEKEQEVNEKTTLANTFLAKAQEQESIAIKAKADAEGAIKELQDDYKVEADRQKDELKKNKGEVEQAKTNLKMAQDKFRDFRKQADIEKKKIEVDKQRIVDDMKLAQDAKEDAEKLRDKAKEDMKIAQAAALDALKEKQKAEAETEATRNAAVKELEAIKEENERLRIDKENQDKLNDLLKQNLTGPSRPSSAGELSLSLRDVYGEPLKKKVEIVLRSQTGSKVSRSELEPSNTGSFVIRDLPSGIYQLEINSSSYMGVSQFVRISPNSTKPVEVTLPVAPDRIDEVDFEKYNDLPAEARQLLEASGNVEGLAGKSGKDLYDDLDRIRKAGMLNIIAKSQATKLADGRNILSFVKSIASVRGDRMFAEVSNELLNVIKQESNRNLFSAASAALYTPPQGFESAGSFRTKGKFANLQLTFFVKDDRVIADIDIDEGAGLEGRFQTLSRSLTGQNSHPYEIHQLLISQGIKPAYKLKP